MSESQKMTLRVQSPEGTARVQVSPDEPTAALYERVHSALGLASFAFALHTDRARRTELPSSKSRRVADAGLRHGDMLYLSPVNGAVLFDGAPPAHPAPPAPPAPADDSMRSDGEAGPSSASAPAPAAGAPAAGAPAPRPEEDEVDLELYQTDGSIQRQRDEKLCRHGARARCVHCAPLEPWDAQYLQAHNIKHMSFHAYLRKVTAGKFVALEEMSCKIKPGCKEHPPWPRGVCSACQPGPVTLARQAYRHVDNVLVEHGALVERFLSFWRATGRQRVGFLYGRYERHPDVPLGVRARVAAVYEPPQAGERDAVALQPDAADPKREALREVAAGLGLRRVGWIFTDLLPDGDGRVQHIRGVDTHFLSAQECCTAGHWQQEHPSACRHSPSGYFGSKFVTVCVTGDAERRVHLEGYQVSGQCQALVRDGVLVPTRDAPELGYIRDSSDRQYVPDVFYKEKDSYGNEVSVGARRVPVAYLLVDVPAGVAAGGAPLLAPAAAPPAAFPPAHRPLQGHLQTLHALHDHLQSAPSFLEAVSDLHVLLYLATNEALPLRGEALAPLLAAVRARDAAAAAAWRRRPQPATLLQLLAHAAAPPAPSPPGAGAPPAHQQPAWTCPLCTFHNSAARDACEMCAMPKNSGM